MFEFLSDLFSVVFRMMTDVTFLIILLIVVAIVYYTTDKRNYAYFIDNSLDPEFVIESRRILRDSYVNNTHNIKEVFDKESADIEIYLVPREKMIALRGSKKQEMYPGTNKPIYFSWTYHQDKPIIYIDEVNWRYGVVESGLSVSDYRTYLIQHEFMHALGYDHQECNSLTAPNGVCPIMYQSTRGCPAGFKCGYDITKFDYENRI